MISFQQAADLYWSKQWPANGGRGEGALVERAKQGVTSDLLRDFAAFFQVARQFPKRNVVRADDFAPIVAPLQRALKEIRPDTVVDRVTGLAGDLTRVPGLTIDARTPLSACSKFVWLFRPDIGTIYDRRALNSLRSHFGCNVKSGVYASFVAAFRDLLESKQQQIAETLPKAMNREPLPAWWPAKLLDLWLYHNGGKSRLA